MEGIALFIILFTFMIVAVFSIGGTVGQNKFNIGDHVKVVDGDNFEYNDEKFEITKIYSKRNDVLYAGMNTHGYYEDQLEKINPIKKVTMTRYTIQTRLGFIQTEWTSEPPKTDEKIVLTETKEIEFREK